MCVDIDVFDSKIRIALDLAIQDVLINEKKLLQDKCSERAIVHWLANYFLEHIRREIPIADKDMFFNHQNGYTVDVEYNRIGAKPNIKRVLGDSALIDMIFHHRADTATTNANPIEQNILCVEVKSPRLKSDTAAGKNELADDEARIRALVVDKPKSKSQPAYLYGATIYFSSSQSAYVHFYKANDNNSPYCYEIIAPQ